MFILALTNLIRGDVNRSTIFQRADSTIKGVSHYPLDTVKKTGEPELTDNQC